MAIGKIIKRSPTVLTPVFLILLFSDFSTKPEPQQQNQPPGVKIVNPKNNTIISLNTPVNYEISVADKEDGDSKYDEINAKEVLLEVRYLKDKSKARSLINAPTSPDAAGLVAIRTSNCFSCHNFNSKAMGPSFDEIAQKYKPTKANTDSLVKRITAGSTGIWGKEKMPSHPELSQQDIKSTVLWILKNGVDTNDNYFIGLNGIVPATAVRSPGAYMFVASYIDHGLKNEPGKQRLKGQDVAVLYAK